MDVTLVSRELIPQAIFAVGPIYPSTEFRTLRYIKKLNKFYKVVHRPYSAIV